MDQRIISSKVYESLQVPTENTRTTTGKILYANSYSGIAPVQMPEDLRTLIDSDFGLIGKNILVQLEKKMKGYSNGPWYVDSRDGVIYIHNRKFFEEPVTVYTYQGENGEVLRVSFSTQTITKSVKAVIHPTIDPETKDLSIISSSILEPDKKEEKAPLLNSLFTPPWNPVDNTQVSGVDSKGIEDYHEYPTGNPLAEWSANNKALRGDYEKAMAKEVEYRQAMREFDALGPAGALEKAIQRRIDSMTTEELRVFISEGVVGLLPEDKQDAVNAIFKNFSTGEGLTSNLKKLFEHDTFIFKGEEAIESPVIEDVNPVDYDPEGGPIRGMGHFQAQERGLKALEKDPHVDVLSTKPTIDYSRPMQFTEPGTNKPKGSGGYYYQKVQVKHLKKVQAEIPIFKLYSNLFSRYGGADRFAWAAHANANGGLKYTERKLICQMQVVGRPMLESSQIIVLNNVGSKWSGLWYIKKCTHSMDAGQGYITDLELVKNNSKDGSTSSRTDVSTQNIVAGDAKTQGKTPKGKDKKASSTTKMHNLHWTYNEAAYFIINYYDPATGGLRFKAPIGEYIRKKCYYNDVNANDPVAIAEGMAYSEGNTVTSDGELIPGKIKLKKIEVPENYHVKFDEEAISEAIMAEALKHKINIKK